MLHENSKDEIQTLYREFLSALKKSNFTGEIKTDYATRLTVATDNSIYQVIPEAVIFPRSTEDAASITALANQPRFREMTFSARGGGTGTNGQSLSNGICLDFSKYMTNILEINSQEKWVRVQPGVVLDQLNLFLKSFQLQFAPEISPSNRATIGGMVNTDACGVGSKILGRTSDHVLDLTCVLSDGSVANTREIAERYDAILSYVVESKGKILEKWGSAPRSLNGYNLKKFVETGLYTALLCGSEGTLAIITECKLNLISLPLHRKLMVVHYRNFNDALRAKPLNHASTPPLIIETIDEKLLNLAREEPNYFLLKNMIDVSSQKTGAINLLEWTGDDEKELEAIIEDASKKIIDHQHEPNSAIGFYVAKDDKEIKQLWNLRKQSVGLISKSLQGARRPIPFIEDTAVPPEHLAEYIQEFRKLLDDAGLIYGMYGHVDAGCVHVRPALDLRSNEDVHLLKKLSDDVVALVKKYRGVLWGEHGQGYRCQFGKDFFGDDLYEIIKKIKTTFDPFNQLNPGKIAVSSASYGKLVGLTDSLRAEKDKQISSELQKQFSAPLSCNGNGACFNFSTLDVMCPSYKVTKERIHSPKGRSVLLREWTRLLSLTSKKRKSFEKEVYASLNGCLGCKACTTQCPLNVDIPQYKSQFLQQYFKHHRRPIRDFLIALTEPLAQWQSYFPVFSRFLFNNFITEFFTKTFFKLIDVPKISTISLKKELKKRGVCDESNLKKSNVVVLIQDAFTSFYEPQLVLRVVDFLTLLGFSIYVPPFFQNGKPLHAKGFLTRFSELAKQNVKILKSFSEKNIPLIGIDPSITLTYRDDYPKSGAESVKVFLLQEWLIQNIHLLKPISKNTDTHYLLTHCSEKSLAPESESQWQTIFASVGLTLVTLPSGCCGMAGSYGHEMEHKNNSKKLFEMNWKNYVENKNICVTGYSCRSQTKRFAQKTLPHPIEILLEHFHVVSKTV